MSRAKILGVLASVIVVLLVFVGMTTQRLGGRASHMNAKSADSAALDQLRALGYMRTEKAANVGQAIRMAPPAAAPEAAKQADPQGSSLDLNALSNPNEKSLYLIKTATLNIEVADAKAAQQQLITTVQGAGGYIGNLQESVGPLGLRTVTIQIRIPADKFDTALSGIEPLGKVLAKQVNTQDVSEEYVDTDSRSRNLKKTEERLLDHLNKSARLEDTLKLEQELSRVRQEIERLDGRLRFLGNRVAFSSVQVTLQETPKAEPVLPPETFSTAKIATQAMRSLVEFGQRIWTRAIWLGVWSVVWLPILVVAWLVVRRVRRPVS